MSIASISVWIPKGGCGKSTVAVNIAAAFSRRGATVSLVDLDPQAGSLIFASIAKRLNQALPFTIGRSVNPGANLVIYDHGPTMIEAVPGDVVVMPTLLDAASYSVFVPGTQRVQIWNKPLVEVPNRVNTSRQAHRKVLERFHPNSPFLRDRSIYNEAYSRGQSIYDCALSGRLQAIAEMEAVTNRVEATLKTLFLCAAPSRAA